MAKEYTFLPIKTDKESLAEISTLLQDVFKNKELFSFEYLKWQYADNPNGKVLGYNAYCEGQLAAHYATLPVKSAINGVIRNGLLSLNTATHPDHQGQKLFTRLADQTYATGAENGYEYVVGVANQNSTPGFLKKLGFDLISPLDAKLFVAMPKIKANQAIAFERFYNTEIKEWRLKNPNEKYLFSKAINNKTAVFSHTKFKSVNAWIGNFADIKPLTFSTRKFFKIWIGIDNSLKWNNLSSCNIPAFMKPSPLNLIFKNLTATPISIDKNNLRFWAVDFDAY